MMITRSQVKYIQSLAHKKFRDTEGLFIVEGPKITLELLQLSSMRPKQVYALREWIAGLPRDLQHIPVVEVSEAELERLSGLTTPNQVLAVFEKPVFPPPVWATGIHLVLDGIQDPGNMGTIVRLADWFGIGTVLCTPDTADVFNPKAVQSTMGSIGRVQVLYEEPAHIIRAGLPVYAAVLDGESLYGMERIRNGFIVVGNESKGISDALLEVAGLRVTIPRIGEAESLNAAVATGIILSHLVG